MSDIRSLRQQVSHPVELPRPLEGVVTVDQPAPVPPLTALLRRWPLAILLVVAGAAGGAYYGNELPVTYTAEARVAVGAGDLSTGAIAGFPTAATQLASNYSRYVNDRGLAGGLSATLSASPIPQSNVIRIEGSSGDADASTTTVAEAAKDLIKQVNKGEGKTTKLLEQYTALSTASSAATVQQDAAQAEVDRLETKPNPDPGVLAAAQAQLASTSSQAAIAELQLDAIGARYRAQEDASTGAKLVLINDAQLVSTDQAAHRQRYGLLGAVAGLMLALLAAVGLERRGGLRGRRTSRGRRGGGRAGGHR